MTQAPYGRWPFIKTHFPERCRAWTELPVTSCLRLLAGSGHNTRQMRILILWFLILMTNDTKETKENMTLSGRVRINTHRHGLPKPNSPKSGFESYLYKCFLLPLWIWRKGDKEKCLSSSWPCTANRDLGDGCASELSPSAGLLSVTPYLSCDVARQWIVPAFTVPSSPPETVQ